MDIKFFARKYPIFIAIVMVILTFSLWVSAVTFTSETYVEISPTIRGTVCIMEGDTCVSGSEKQIIFGLASVWGSQEDKEQGYYGASSLPLIIFDNQMFRAIRVTTISGTKRAEGTLTSWTGEAVMNTLNPDGTEVQDTAQSVFSVDLRTGSISDLDLTVDGNTYTLTSIEKALKLEGIVLSGDYIVSDDLLKMNLYKRGSGGRRAGERGIGYDFIGSGSANAVLDYGDGASDTIFPTFGETITHYYQNDGVYNAVIRLTYPSGQVVSSNNIQITVDSSAFSPTEEIAVPFIP